MHELAEQALVMTLLLAGSVTSTDVWDGGSTLKSTVTDGRLLLPPPALVLVPEEAMGSSARMTKTGRMMLGDETAADATFMVVPTPAACDCGQRVALKLAHNRTAALRARAVTHRGWNGHRHDDGIGWGDESTSLRRGRCRRGRRRRKINKSPAA